jgi:hypothetical protein
MLVAASHRPEDRRMTDSAGAPGRSPPPGDKRELVDAYLGLLRAESDKAATAAAPAPPRHAVWKPLVAAALTVLAVALWVVPDSRLGFARERPLSPQLQEAGARFAMYLAVQRIHAYERQAGRLPSTLAEAGGAAPGIEYRLAGPDAYTLSMPLGERVLTFRSSDSLDLLLGDSPALLGRRR